MSLAETLVETAAPAATSPTTALPVTTAPGIEAWHVESPVVPMIALAFTFEGGAAQDPAGKAGCAQMLARLLDEGAVTSPPICSRSGWPPGPSNCPSMPAPTRSAAR
jgi:zinc protease